MGGRLIGVNYTKLTGLVKWTRLGQQKRIGFDLDDFEPCDLQWSTPSRWICHLNWLVISMPLDVSLDFGFLDLLLAVWFGWWKTDGSLCAVGWFLSGKIAFGYLYTNLMFFDSFEQSNFLQRKVRGAGWGFPVRSTVDGLFPARRLKRTWRRKRRRL